MYRTFFEKYCQEYSKSTSPVTHQWYNEIFLTKFNLRFQRPRVDTCSTCDDLAVSLQAGDKSAEVELDLHHRLAEATTKAMAHNTKNPKTSNSYVISFDLQQQMYLPQLTHTEMYYAQQLACCNLGIHNSIKETGYMCLWIKNFGGRGSLEIPSCIYH